MDWKYVKNYMRGAMYEAINAAIDNLKEEERSNIVCTDTAMEVILACKDYFTLKPRMVVNANVGDVANGRWRIVCSKKNVKNYKVDAVPGLQEALDAQVGSLVDKSPSAPLFLSRDGFRLTGRQAKYLLEKANDVAGRHRKVVQTLESGPQASSPVREHAAEQSQGETERGVFWSPDGSRSGGEVM